MNTRTHTSGAILLMTLMVLGMFAVILIATTAFISQQYNQTVQQEQKEKSFHAAEAGVDYVLHALNEAVYTTEGLITSGTLSGSVPDAGFYDLTFRRVVGSLPGQKVRVIAKGTDTSGRFCQGIDVTVHRTSQAQYSFIVASWDRLPNCSTDYLSNAPAVALTAPANNAIFPPNATITLAADASDPDNIIRVVEFFSGTQKLGEDTTSADGYSFQWPNVSRGSYTLTAKVTDNLGAQATSSPVMIAVTDAPTVSLTKPDNNAIFLNTDTIPLEATAGDTDGTVKKVEFMVDGVVAATDTDGTNGWSGTTTNLSHGNRTVKAVATDNLNATATSNQVTITVRTAPSVSITSPTNGATFPSGSATNLSATASDPEGVASVEFFQNNTSIGQAGRIGTRWEKGWYNIPEGTIALTAKAMDREGTPATSAPVTITVTKNKPPTVTITAPSDGQVFTARANFSLVANASDPDGFVSSVDFYNNGTRFAQGPNAPLTNVPAGTYIFTAIATDNSGAPSPASNPITIKVNAPPTVTLTAPANGTTYTGSASYDIPLSANAADTDGTVAKVEFFQGTTSIGAVTSAPYTYIWTGVPTGLYTLTAKATDNNGAITTSNPITIKVNYIFSDTFTERSATTTLTSHTPDIGTSWAQLINQGGALRAYSTLLRYSGGAGQGTLYTANATYPSANYDVQVKHVSNCTSTTYYCIIAARVIDANNMYAFTFTGTGGELRKKVAGVWTTLATASSGISNGSTTTLRVQGSTITVFQGTSQLIQVTDTDIAAAGKAGVGMGDMTVDTNWSMNAQQLDDFAVLFIPPPDVFSDTFTEASSTTTLASHTPNIGASWSSPALIAKNNGTLAVNAAADDVRPGGTGNGKGALYTANATATYPYPTDYEVHVKQVNGDTGTANFNTIAARIQDNKNMYAFTFNKTSSQLRKEVNGTWSTLGSATAGIGDTSTVKLRVQGSTITVFKDGAQLVQVTDTSITAAGKGGVGMGHIGISNGWSLGAQELDNFRVVPL